MIPRFRFALAILLGVLVLFTGRLMYLQLARFEEYRQLSESNFQEERYIAPLRGRILARDGTVLADNRIAYDLMYWGGKIEGWSRLRALLAIESEPRPPDPSKLEERLHGAVLAWNIPDALVPAVEERVAGQPSLYLRERIERTYPTNLAAQVVGYTTQADPERFPGYTVQDLVGVSGIESSFEQALFGVGGARTVQVDNRRVELYSELVTQAEPGRDVMLTIDPQVQRIAEDVLSGALTYINNERDRVSLPHETQARGALIALDPRNGEIVAMASIPTFDQNVFTKRPSDPDAVAALLTDSDNLPMSNRAFEAFPPASTFKLVTALTLLEQGFISTGTEYFCSASLNFGGIRWDNWSYPGSRGTYNLVGAIADSCNTFFWRAVLDTPGARNGWGPFIEAMTTWARTLGFGAEVGIGLDGEKSGRVPDDAWSRSFHGWPWRPGDTFNVAIGQGDTLATPIQDAQLVATIAMDGLRVQPHLVRSIGDLPSEVAATQIESRYWSVLQTGMRHMITDYGTNYVLGPGANFPIAVAGKTGTAQNAKGDGYDHVWFAGYAPVVDPEIVLVVFVEHGNRSTGVAVPAARDFFVQYFGLEEFMAEAGN